MIPILNGMRVNVIVIVLLVLGWQAHWIDGALSAIACQYIKQLIVQFKESKGKHTLIVIGRIDCYIGQTVYKRMLFLVHLGNGFSCVVTPPFPPFGVREIHEDNFYLPAVLLWNPIVTHPHFAIQRLNKCHHCGLPMHEVHWNDGSSSSTQPRILHGIGNVVYLVTAVYSCDNNHRILAHDETLLQCFPSQTLIPFVLLHRTGFT